MVVAMIYKELSEETIYDLCLAQLLEHVDKPFTDVNGIKCLGGGFAGNTLVLIIISIRQKYTMHMTIICLSLITFPELLTVYSPRLRFLKNIGPIPLSYSLFSSYCLALYGCALWKLSLHALKGLEVMFNNCLRRIWNLPS